MGQFRQLLVLLTEVDPHSAALRSGLALAHVSGASVHVLGLFEPSEEHLLREERLNEADIKRQYDHYCVQLRALAERHRGSGVTRRSTALPPTISAARPSPTSANCSRTW